MRTTIQVAGVVAGMVFACMAGVVGAIGALVCIGVSVCATLYGVEECATHSSEKRRVKNYPKAA